MSLIRVWINFIWVEWCSPTRIEITLRSFVRGGSGVYSSRRRYFAAPNRQPQRITPVTGQKARPL